MASTVFIDPASPAPYSARSLTTEGLGGTEASVVRVAEALDAVVVQPNRQTAEGRYLPSGPIDDVGHLVVVRDPEALLGLHHRYPNARLHLWLHDRMRPGSRRAGRLRAALAKLGDRGLSVICVSDYQRRDVLASLGRLPNRRSITARTIPNPIDNDLEPDGSPFDSSKLVFFSAPAKGLSFALDAFQSLRRALPDLTFDIAHPGYQPPRVRAVAGVRWLGSLPHPEIVARVRTALCVFAPNFVVAETFGLVLAEANAVGTPVLTHAFGAAPEVLADPRQTLPIELGQRVYEQVARLLPDRWRPAAARLGAGLGLFDAYLERIEAWREGGRPAPVVNPSFRTSAVAAAWAALLAGRE